MTAANKRRCILIIAILTLSLAPLAGLARVHIAGNVATSQALTDGISQDLRASIGTALAPTGASTPSRLAPDIGQTNAASPAAPILGGIPLTVNIIYAGIPTSLTDRSAIISMLPPAYTQIDRERATSNNGVTPYAEYDIRYNFQIAPTSFITGYVNFLQTNHYVHQEPPWLSLTSPYVAMVDARSAESYIWSNLASTYTGYTIVLLDVVSSTPNFNFVHFYNGTATDPDFHSDRLALASNYMVSYGGSRRMLFVDFSAGPASYCGTAPCLTRDPNTGTIIALDSPLTPFYKLNLSNSGDRQTAQTEIGWSVREAVESRFVPSFLYEPSYYKNYYFDITIFSFDTSIVWSQFIKPAEIKATFDDLQAFASSPSRIAVSVTEVPATNDRDFYNAFQGSFDPQTGKYICGWVGQQGSILDYLVNNRSRYLYDQAGESVDVIPVIIAAGQDNLNCPLGVAAPNGQGELGLVFETYDHNQFRAGVGMTYLTIHEAGHAFGLAHPHDFNDFQYGDISGMRGMGGITTQGVPLAELWLWDFSSDPMTYAASNNPYDVMAKDNLYQGLTAYLLQQTKDWISYGIGVEKSLGYGVDPPQVLSDAKAASNNFDSAKAVFSAPNPDYASAVLHALDARNYARSAVVGLYQNLLSITYQVNDGDGHSLGGASLSITSPNGTMISRTSDSTGQVILSSLPWGDYRYDIQYRGTAVGNKMETEQASSQRTLVANVYTLSIPEVTAADGDKLEVAVKVTPPNGPSFTVQSGYSERLPAGTYSFSVTYKGVSVYTSSTNLTSSQVLKPQLKVYDLSLKVTDTFGLAVSGATVTLQYSDGTIASGTTSSDGAALFDNLPDGSYKETISYLGQMSSSQLSGSDLSTGHVSARTTLSMAGIGTLAFIVVVIAVISVFLLLKRQRRSMPIPPPVQSSTAA